MVLFIEPPSIDVNTNTYEVEITEGEITPVQFYYDPANEDTEYLDDADRIKESQ